MTNFSAWGQSLHHERVLNKFYRPLRSDRILDGSLAQFLDEQEANKSVDIIRLWRHYPIWRYGTFITRWRRAPACRQEGWSGSSCSPPPVSPPPYSPTYSSPKQSVGKWFLLKRDFVFVCMYLIQHCFICRPSDSSVSENAGMEPRSIVTLPLAVKRSNHSARSHPPLC